VSSVSGYLPDSNDASTEVAECSLLKYVTRKRVYRIVAQKRPFVYSSIA
jgi:hypothetical protein